MKGVFVGIGAVLGVLGVVLIAVGVAQVVGVVLIVIGLIALGTTVGGRAGAASN